MGKLIKSDGNGGIVISKGLALVLSFLGLASFIWAASSSYTIAVMVRPFEERVAKLERTDDERALFLQAHCIAEAEKFNEINRKMDLILYKVEEQNKGN